MRPINFKKKTNLRPDVGGRRIDLRKRMVGAIFMLTGRADVTAILNKAICEKKPIFLGQDLH